MTVSLMAARLLSNAYYHKDYTGWPDWVRMDDGVWMTQLFLSVSKRRMVYSVVVKARDARKDQCIFVLCMDQVAKGMEPYHNKVGIMGVLLSEQEGDNRLVISIDYGEHIVLDVVNQAAVRSLEEAKRSYVEQVPVEDPEELDDGDAEDDPIEGTLAPVDGVLGSISSRIQRKRENRELTRNARAHSPPKSRIGVRRSR